MNIIRLWNEGSKTDWENALAEYYKVPSVKRNLELEKRMDKLNSDSIRNLNVEAFYQFLHKEYFVWKYTAKNRLATTRKQLERYETEGMSTLKKYIKIFSMHLQIIRMIQKDCSK